MRTTRRILLVGALGVMLGTLPGGPLAAQAAPDGLRPAVDALYTRISFDADGPSLNAEGLGARLMWTPAGAMDGGASLRNRTDVGLYGAYTRDRAFGPAISFSSIGAGAMADVRPFATPLPGGVEPFVSLGAGVLHTRVDRALSPAPSPLLERSRTAFTLTPGLGARIAAVPGVALQGEVRDLVTFVGDTRHNVAFGVGLRLAF